MLKTTKKRFSNKTKKLAEKHIADIHRYRSPIGYSSAIFAIEVALFVHAKKKNQVQINQAQEDLLIKINTYGATSEEVKEQRRLVDGLRTKVIQKSRVNLVFAPLSEDDLKEGTSTARFVRVDGENPSYSIVLAESLRDIILDRDYPPTELWDADAKTAKKTLRDKTAHEIAHLLYQIIELGADKPSDEIKTKEELDFIKCFVDLFSAQSIVWIDGIPYPQNAVKIKQQIC